MAKENKIKDLQEQDEKANQQLSRKSPQHNKIPWLRSLIEVVVIISSILLAFAIEAWWSEFQIRKVENEILKGINEDFQTNAVLLDLVEDKHNQALIASDILASLVGPEAVLTISNDSIEVLLWAVRYNWTYDPRTGILQSLISGGDVSLIENIELRTSLFAWLDLVKDLNEDELIQRNEIHQNLTPFLTEQIPLRPIFRITEDDGLSSDFIADYESLFRSMTFQNLIEARRRFVLNILEELNGVRIECNRILSITGEEIKKR